MINMKRREFLKHSTLALGGVITAGTLAAKAAPESPATQLIRCDPFENVTLGKSGIKMTRLCMGTGVHGGQRQSNQTRMGKEKFTTLIDEAFERGVRVFDMADLYGTHPFLIPALKGVPRKDFIVISKIWWNKGGIPESERPPVDDVIARFLKELNTDYIDLVLLHCVTSPKWNEDLGEQMQALAALKKKGVVRAHGVSCHSLEALQTAAKEPWVDSVHARINPYGMSMDGPAEKVAPVLKSIHANGKGVVGMKIMGEGRLRGDDARRDESVKYVMDLGCVDILNVGFEKPEEIDDFAARVKKVKRPVERA